ncbi:MAG: diheme cytochrome c-553 [Bacteroidota bacterium]|nr:diheme cytochrome c-553 [Bacteroidota bacterium]
MKKLSFVFIVVIVAGAFFLSKCSDNNSTEANNHKDTTSAKTPNYGGYTSQVKWGEHLVMSIGCGDCHTPKKMSPRGPVDDSSLLLSGHPAKMPPPDVDRKATESKGQAVTNTLTAWVGPWGISYAANLTSDTTGIGMWSEEQFIFALRNGKYKGLPNSRDLLPPMPWQSLRNLTDDELKAMFSYLKATPPVENVVPAAAPPVSAPQH